MSVYYLPNKPIEFSKIKGFNQGKFKEVKTEDTTATRACLTDGQNCLWATRTGDGFTTFATYGLNDASEIIRVLEQHFKVKIYDEYNEQFKKLVDGTYRQEYMTMELTNK